VLSLAETESPKSADYDEKTPHQSTSLMPSIEINQLEELARAANNENFSLFLQELHHL